MTGYKNGSIAATNGQVNQQKNENGVEEYTAMENALAKKQQNIIENDVEVEDAAILEEKNGKLQFNNRVQQDLNSRLQDGVVNGASSDVVSYSYDIVKEIAEYLLARTSIRPKIGVICGSGLNSLANSLTKTDAFTYESIPHFPISTVEGHVGRMVFGYLDGVPVMCMQGRFHYYEGYPLAKCSMPVRVMKLVGCTHLLATNAAGGLSNKFKVGDIMLVRDHINMMGLAGNSPLQGPNDHRFGPRFPPMTNGYDKELIKIAKKISVEMGIEKDVHEGVYTCLGGPNYETVAELRMLRILGVDAVGMSTVHEVITARHCDLVAFAFSLITNKCATDYDSGEEEANHEEVVSVGHSKQDTCAELMRRMVKAIDELTRA